MSKTSDWGGGDLCESAALTDSFKRMKLVLTQFR